MNGWRAAGILAGYLADLLIADPRRYHPVAGFGQLAAAGERICYRDSRIAGAAHTGVLVAGAGLAGLVAQRRAGSGMPVLVLTAVATWVALGGTTLTRTASAMADALEADDLEAARRILPSLCGRDPASLDTAGLLRATCESLAENTSDATVAPLFWAGVAGVPAVLAYRAANTLDAMIGYRSPRYLRFGWAAARFDDVANLVPARISGALTVLAAPTVGGSAVGAVGAWRRDAARHPSPNAGVAEAAFAGALGIRLGGPTQYRHQLEIRPVLGDGPAPGAGDLRRAIRLARVVQGLAVIVAVAISAVGRSGRPACLRR